MDKADLADPSPPFRQDGQISLIHAAQSLALEVARKSLVLLKNENTALPLDRSRIRTLAVIGSLANTANIGDKGSSRIRPPYVVTPLAGIRTKAGSSVNVVYESGRNIGAARRAAKQADAVIVVAGLTWRNEGEYIPGIMGGDRIYLGLPRRQVRLIQAMAEESSRCIVVLEGGSAITMKPWVNEVEAILMAWYPGMEGGTAIAEVLFGDVNPSGKLPIVFPESDVQLVPFNPKARSIEYGYYHGYNHFDNHSLKPLFHFGYGLSYTTFTYVNLVVTPAVVGKTGKVEVAVDVANAGAVAGEEVAQLYVGYRASQVERHVKDLKAFARVALQPGETKTVRFEIKTEDLAWYDAKAGCWQVEEIEYEVFVGGSSRPEDLSLRGRFKIAGM